MSNSAVDRNGLPTEAYLLWIHCNRCFEIYMDKRRSFVLLACHHVACVNCAAVATTSRSVASSYKCPICSKIVRACQMGNAMPPHLKKLFNPKPWEAGADVAEIMRFQNKHREHFTRRMEKIHTKYAQQKSNLEKQRAQVQALFLENEKVRRERVQDERRVREVIKQRQQEKREQQKWEQQKREQEQRKNQAQRLLAKHAPMPSTTDESQSTNTQSVLRQQSDLRKHSLPTVFGRGISISASAPAYAAECPRMASPNSTIEVASFAHPPRPSSFRF